MGFRKPPPRKTHVTKAAQKMISIRRIEGLLKQGKKLTRGHPKRITIASQIKSNRKLITTTKRGRR